MSFDNLFALVASLDKQMGDYMVKQLESLGLKGISPSHGSILLALFDGKTLTMNELSERIGKTPQTVTTLAKKLVDRGYMKTEKSQEDGRITLVSLTEDGEALKGSFFDISAELYKNQYRGFSEEEIAELKRLLVKASKNFDGKE